MRSQFQHSDSDYEVIKHLRCREISDTHTICDFASCFQKTDYDI